MAQGYGSDEEHNYEGRWGFVQAIDDMVSWQESNDPETAHSFADKILCDFLKATGNGVLVKEWEKIKRWYG
jgi:hypothetical protein